jgi:hypothetical protein
VSLNETKSQNSLFRRYLWKCRSHCGKEAFVGEPVPWRRIIRGLDCVGLGNLIVDVFIDAVAVSVASNSLLLRRFFVGGEWKVSFAWSDW